MSGMRLPLEALTANRTAIPPDLTSSGQTLFPALPQPAQVTEQQAQTAPVFDTTRFAESFTFPVNFAAAGESLVLPRTNQKRLGLLIVNTNIPAGIFYCFSQTANNVNSVPIASGGNRLFDVAVPQGDLHIFASGAGLVIIEYMLPSNY